MIETVSLTKKSIQKTENFKIDLFSKEGTKGSLIPLLQSAQDTYGYIPEFAICYISEIVGIPAAKIYGVITFYAQFRLKPLGKNLIKLCDGTACHVNNSKKMIQTIKDELGIAVGETSTDGNFTLQTVACIGCCSLAPVMMINDTTYGRLTQKKIAKILKEHAKQTQKTGTNND